MNKTELFIKLDKYENETLMFDDTYLAPSVYGLFLGLEFQMDVSDIFSVGDIITIDKTNKSINPWADGTQSIIGITASSIYPAPGSLVFTDRPLQLPISFTSNENGVIYQGTSISSDWNKVDLSDDVAFPITFNIADVREINNRNGAYSKTIVIPGTKENNKVFKYIFDIQGVDNYDTRIRVKANVVVDTIPVLEGYIQLDTINCDNNEYWTYNCIIYGENANFSKNIDQNALLNSLDFTEFNHNKTLDAITQSWTGDYTYGYYYPLLDYNNGRNPVELQIASQSQLSLINENFKPAIYVKQYWDKIFKLYGYTYESEFLNSEAFTSLIIPTNIKVIKNDDDWRYNSSFAAGIRTGVVFNYPVQTSTATYQTDYNNDTLLSSFTMDDASPFFYDPNNIFYDIPGGSFRYENTYQGNIPKNQKIILNLDYKITLTGGTTSNPYNGIGLVLFYRFYKNGVFSGSTNQGKVVSFGYTPNITPGVGGSSFVTDRFGAQDGTDISLLQRIQSRVVWDTSVNGPLNNNDTLEVRLGFIRYYTGPSEPTPAAAIVSLYNLATTTYKLEFFPTTNGVDGCYFFNDIDTNLISTQPFPLSNSIPANIKQIDFINSIIKMFNLYLSQDKVDPKKIYIEPRDQFYETNFVDWSRKLDISKDILHKPIVDRKKRVFMSYKEDKDLINTFYKSNTNQIYGQYEYITGNEFDTSEQKIDIIFSPSPLSNWRSGKSRLESRLVYTQILDPKGVINTENYNIVDSNIRILYRKNIPLTNVVFRIFDYQSYYSYNTYPYAGHLDDPTSPGLDLSFAEPREFYYINYYGYTSNNLYTLYYEQFFEEVYGLESKHIVAYVYLTPQDIIDFDYRKLVYLDSASSGTGGYFRVNKIEYDPFNKKSYKVELIKVLNNFKSKYNKKLAINTTIGDVGVALPDWGTGLVTDSNYNSGGKNIVNGVDNSVRSDFNIVGGRCNQVLVGSSNIVTGYRNNTNSDNSGIISGGKTTIYGTGRYSNVIGGFSQSLSGRYSNIIGGCNNIINIYSSNNQILGGCNNTISYNPTGTSSISQTNNSLILGGINNKIEVGPTTSATDNVFILGGQNNTIVGGVTNSFILGGENFTATQSNTIYLQGNVVVNGVDISSGIGGSGSAISVDEIAFGTGTGITSSTELKFNPTTHNLIASFNSQIITNSKYSSIIGGICNVISYYSSPSVIIGGTCNIIATSSIYSSIINGVFNKIYSSGYSSVIGGRDNLITTNSYKSSIIGGNNNLITTSNYRSSIIGGQYNTIAIQSYGSSIIGGQSNKIEISSKDSAIVGGQNNTLSCYSRYNSILGGRYNSISPYTYNSSIIGGFLNKICVASNYSSIIGGQNNDLNCSSTHALIISGVCNILTCFSSNSIIIGGSFNIMYCSSFSSIISSGFSTASNSNGSLIIGGCNNSICGATNSMIINATNITLTASNTTYIGGNVLVNGLPISTATPIPNKEITFGNTTGTGITSSNRFIFNRTNLSFIFGINNQSNDTSNTSLIGGLCNIISTFSNYSSIIAGQYNTMEIGNAQSVIIGGNFNKMCECSIRSSIIGGCCNTLINCSNQSSIIGGSFNIVNNNSNCSSIVGGYCNKLDQSVVASVFGGNKNTICTGQNSVIMGGNCNYLCNSYSASILGGKSNILCGSSCVSSIVGGEQNLMSASNQSSIVVGSVNKMYGSDQSVIIGGSGASMSNSPQSLILGGSGLTLNGESAVVLVPNLKVNDDITLTNVSGQATISATNSVVVNNTYIKVGSKILLSGDSNVTLWTSNLVPNTSFKINSSSTGNYTIFYLIIN
jgi:hypothetical protein